MMMIMTMIILNETFTRSKRKSKATTTMITTKNK